MNALHSAAFPALLCSLATGCSTPASTPQPQQAPTEAAAAAPTQPSDVGVEEPVTKQDPTDDLATRLASLRLDRDGRHLTVTSEGPFHEVVTTPTGAAFTHHHGLWVLSLEPDRVEAIELQRGEDPHGLAADEESLYWLSQTGPAKLNLEALVRDERPFIPSGFDGSISIGDTLYAIGWMKHVWRAEDEMGSVINTDINPKHVVWLGRIRAADHMFVLGLLEAGRSSIYRYRIGRKPHRIDTKWSLPRVWSLRPDGALLFVRDDRVYRLERKDQRPRELFEEPNIAAMCWCGPDVCTLSKDQGELRRHHRTRERYDVIASVPGKAEAIDCRASSVALITETGDRTSLHIISLGSTPIEKSER